MRYCLVLLMIVGNFLFADVSRDILEPDILDVSEDQIYTNDYFHCSITIPESWYFDQTSTNFLTMVVHEPTGVVLKLKAYKTATPVTVDVVQLRRSGTLWDGWNLLASKYGDEKTIFLTGVDEKFSRVMEKKEYDDNLELKRTLAVEDVYVRDNFVYAMYSSFDRPLWGVVSADLKQLMASFYILDY
jgi:hypothetical protein